LPIPTAHRGMIGNRELVRRRKKRRSKRAINRRKNKNGIGPRPKTTGGTNEGGTADCASRWSQEGPQTAAKEGESKGITKTRWNRELEGRSNSYTVRKAIQG